MRHYITRKDCRVSARGSDYFRRGVTFGNPSAAFPPESHIYCGNVFWEMEIIRKSIGDHIVDEVHGDSIQHLIPLNIRPSSPGFELEEQLERAWGRLGRTESSAWRIVLVNGTGTMLGDSLFGASVAAEIVGRLLDKGLYLRFDILLAINAAEQSELIWQRTNGVDKIFRGALSLEKLAGYHAVIDFCQLLKLDGYATEHRFDFYLNHFGISPSSVSAFRKRPRIAVQRRALQEVRAKLEALRNNVHCRITCLQPDASTPVRSMPDDFLSCLVNELLKDSNRYIVGASSMLRRLPLHPRIIDCHELTKSSLDHYLALLSVADEIVSVDTLALNVACGLDKYALGFFAQSDHLILSRYWSKLVPILVPQAQSLAFWHRHKADNDWPSAEPSYRKAWSDINLETVLNHWEVLKARPIGSVPEPLVLKLPQTS